MTAIASLSPALTLGLALTADIPDAESLNALLELASRADIAAVVPRLAPTMADHGWVASEISRHDATSQHPVAVYLEPAMAGAVHNASALAVGALGPISGLDDAGRADVRLVKEVSAIERAASCHPGTSTFLVTLPPSFATTMDSLAQDLRNQWHHVLALTVGHLGINTHDAADASDTTAALADLLSQPVVEFPGAYFVGNIAEVVKGSFLGSNGHIALNTPRPDVAEAYLRRRGIAMRANTRNEDPAGRLNTIYLEDEIGGFALHLRANRE